MLEHCLSQRGVTVSKFQTADSICNSLCSSFQLLSRSCILQSRLACRDGRGQSGKAVSCLGKRILQLTCIDNLLQSLLGNRKRIAGLHNLNGSNCSSHSATCPTGGHLNTLKADKIARCSTIEVFQVTDFNSKLSIFSYCRLNFVNGSFVNRTITHQTNSSTRSAFKAKL